MIKIKTNWSTNKQTNKHVLDIEYLSQIKSDLHEIFRVYFCGCPKMIKIKKSINKQTNKQKTFLDPKYLSQIKWDPREIFRAYSCECPKMIKIKIKQFNKQTNKKQTNKHILPKSNRILKNVYLFLCLFVC